jgi:hypothetical protein
MASQGQAVGRQSYRWFEPFVVALAIAAIVITLAWGAITALSAPTTVAPERTVTQMLQEPGLLDQRKGERGGAVYGGGLQYTGIPTVPNVITDPNDGLKEHRRGERGGSVSAPVENRRGELEF